MDSFYFYTVKIEKRVSPSEIFRDSVNFKCKEDAYSFMKAACSDYYVFLNMYKYKLLLKSFPKMESIFKFLRKRNVNRYILFISKYKEKQYAPCFSHVMLIENKLNLN